MQLLKASGCRVLGSDLDPSKLELARQFGADLAVDPGALADASTSFPMGMVWTP